MSLLPVKCPLQLGRKGLAALKFISRLKPLQLLPICLIINFDSMGIARWFLIGPGDFASHFCEITVTRFRWHIVEHFEWVFAASWQP